MTESGNAAAEAYRSEVAEIIGGRAPDRRLPPAAPILSIVRSHRPGSVADLAPAERRQLRAAFFADSDEKLDRHLADDENEVEAAEIVDEAGVLRFRLYGW